MMGRALVALQICIRFEKPYLCFVANVFIIRKITTMSDVRIPDGHDSGPSYEFYMELTRNILDLVLSLESRSNSTFLYRGLDFSHVFESLLYFACINDGGLRSLYEGHTSGRAAGAAEKTTLLESDVAELLAQHWFGISAFTKYRRKGNPALLPIRRLVRMFRWLWGRPLSRKALSGGAQPLKSFLPNKYNSLLYGRSVRFVDYLMPIAHRCEGGYAFLVPREARDVQAMLAKRGEPFFIMPLPSARMRPLKNLVGRYAPELGLLGESVETALLRLQPNVVILAEGNSPEDEVINQVGHKLKIPVVCVQQGWSPIFHPGFCNLSYDTMLVWGDGFSDLLAPNNSRTRFVSTGNMALTMEFMAPSLKPPGAVFFHQGVGGGLGGRLGSEMMVAAAERVAKQCPQNSIYYRPHPVVPLDEASLQRLCQWPNITIHDPKDVPLAASLKASRVSISIYSSTILESVAAGTIPIVFNMTTMPNYIPDIAGLGAGLELQDCDAVVSAVKRLLLDEQYASAFEPAMRSFKKKYFSFWGEEALNRAVAELRQYQGGGRT